MDGYPLPDPQSACGERPGQSACAYRMVAFGFEHLSCLDRKSTRLNSSHLVISYAGFCFQKKHGPAAPLRARGGQLHRLRQQDLRVGFASRVAVVVKLFFNDTATTEIYTLSLHDALPISLQTLRSSPRSPAPWYDSVLEARVPRSEEHTSELQSPCNLVCRLLLEKKK